MSSILLGNTLQSRAGRLFGDVPKPCIVHGNLAMLKLCDTLSKGTKLNLGAK